MAAAIEPRRRRLPQDRERVGFSTRLLYYALMRDKVLRYIRERDLIRPGDRVLVAVSGGADSVGLVRVLLELRSELGAVLGVAHFHHGLRGEAAAADEHFVQDLAKRLELEFFSGRGNVQEQAAEANISLEAAGRQQRYGWLTDAATRYRYNAVATAHTMDDQAETVLMKFLRGAGTRGLAGIYPEMRRTEEPDVRIVRPLLSTSRSEVEAYLTDLEQPWREDESNLDPRFRRNRIRRELLPLLERDYSANVRQALNEAADIARVEETYWDAALEPLLALWHDLPGRLRIFGFEKMHLALQRRLLKRFVEIEGGVASFRHVERMRQCALGYSPGCELPGGWMVVAESDHLWLRKTFQPILCGRGYELGLPVPGEAALPERGRLVRALLVPAAFALEAEPGTLLCADLAGVQLTVRNWRPGDSYWPAHSGSEVKLKRLFSEKKIPLDERSTWPVVLKDGEILWVREFPVADKFKWVGAGDAVRIEVVPNPEV